MPQRETAIEKDTCKYARTLRWRDRKMVFVGRRGCPDRWFMRSNGQLVIIEFKDPNGKLSPHHRREVNWLRENGFEVHVIDNEADGRAVFDSIGDGGHITADMVLALLHRMSNRTVRDVIDLLSEQGNGAFEKDP